MVLTLMVVVVGTLVSQEHRRDLLVDVVWMLVAHPVAAAPTPAATGTWSVGVKLWLRGDLPLFVRRFGFALAWAFGCLGMVSCCWWRWWCGRSGVVQGSLDLELVGDDFGAVDGWFGGAAAEEFEHGDEDGGCSVDRFFVFGADPGSSSAATRCHNADFLCGDLARKLFSLLFESVC